jgi:hypothetical protein
VADAAAAQRSPGWVVRVALIGNEHRGLLARLSGSGHLDADGIQQRQPRPVHRQVDLRGRPARERPIASLSCAPTAAPVGPNPAVPPLLDPAACCALAQHAVSTLIVHSTGWPSSNPWAWSDIVAARRSDIGSGLVAGGEPTGTSGAVESTTLTFVTFVFKGCFAGHGLTEVQPSYDDAPGALSSAWPCARPLTQAFTFRSARSAA